MTLEDERCYKSAMRSYSAVILILLFLIPVAVADEPQKKAIALTFDDLPLAGESWDHSDVLDVNRRILGALRKHLAPAIGFVNGKKVDTIDRTRRLAALELWLKGGKILGNHTYSHPDFNDLSLAEFIADTERGETIFQQLGTHGQQVRYFRFPFNHTGNDLSKKTGFEKWLSDHHYEIATCTVENSDYLFNRAYVAAIEAGDKKKARQIRASYLDFTDSILDYYERVATDLAGREFPQVFLAHANRLNADSLDEMLTRMERRGYRFVTTGEAQSDAIYRTPDNYVSRNGPMWPYRWAPALGKKIDGRLEPEPPKSIVEFSPAGPANSASKR